MAHFYTATVHPDGYVYLGTTCRSHIIIVTVHRKGLAVLSSRRIYEKGSRGSKALGRASKRFIIPGQYSLQAVSEWLTAISGTDPTPRDKRIAFANGHETTTAAVRRARRIRAVLVESGIWAQRGRLNWNNLPDSFFSVVTLRQFLKGTTHSYRAWWTAYVTHETKNIDIQKTIERAYSQCRIPENKQPKMFEPWELSRLSPEERVRVSRRIYGLQYKHCQERLRVLPCDGLPHTIAGWKELPLHVLAVAARLQLPASPQWPLVLDVIERFGYDTMWERLFADPEKMTPQTFWKQLGFYHRLAPDVDRELILELTGSRPNLESVFDTITTATEVEALHVVHVAYNQASALHERRRIDEQYPAPAVTLPDGWQWIRTEGELAPVLRYHWSTSQELADGVLVGLVYAGSRGNATIALGYGSESDEADTNALWRVRESSPKDLNPFIAMTLRGIVNRLNVVCPHAHYVTPQPLRDAVIWACVRNDPQRQAYLRDLPRAPRGRDIEGTTFVPVPLTPEHPAYDDPQGLIDAYLQHGSSLRELVDDNDIYADSIPF